MVCSFPEPGGAAAACQGGDEGLRVPRAAGAAQGGPVSGAGLSPLAGFCPPGRILSPQGHLKEIHKLRLKSGIFSLAFGVEEFT